jgi:hypothetical protein
MLNPFPSPSAAEATGGKLSPTVSAPTAVSLVRERIVNPVADRPEVSHAAVSTEPQLAVEHGSAQPQKGLGVLSKIAKLRLKIGPTKSFLPSDRSQRKRIIFAGAGALMLLAAALPQLIPIGSAPGAVAPRRGIPLSALQGEDGMKRFNLTRRNPEVPWLEKVFCTGRVNALGCSRAPYHPYFTWWKNFGEKEGVDPKVKGNTVKTILKTFKRPPAQNKYEQREVLLRTLD